MSKTPLIIRQKGLIPYTRCWNAMKQLTQSRTPTTPDELWLLEHPPVFTQGLAGRAEHLLTPGQIPVIHSNRGGQITYHGPGQLIAYTLFDLNRLGRTIRSLVTGLENTMIHVLSHHGIKANSRKDAPGVYIEGIKIGSIGLRVRKGCSYHGLSFNVNMDLKPFSYINPCGMPDLSVTDLTTVLGSAIELDTIIPEFIEALCTEFGYTHTQLTKDGS